MSIHRRLFPLAHDEPYVLWEGPLARVLAYAGVVLLSAAAVFADRALARRAAAADAPYARVTVTRGALGAGGLRAALLSAGAGASAKAYSAALAATGADRRLAPDDPYVIARSTSGAVLHVTLFHGLQRIVLARAADGAVKGVARPVAVVEAERVAAGRIKGSLWLSMKGAGAPDEIVARYADIFKWSIDFFRESHDGDSFAVEWTKRRTADGRALALRIRAASYDGSATGRRLAVRVRDAFYDETGQSLARRFLRAPLKFSRISSRFTASRHHPILGFSRPHRGTDYAAPRGTPVHSVGAGLVVEAGREGGFGNVVKIKHGPTYTSLYAHLSGFARGVRRGARVHQGQVVGYVGMTGLATGPHLHFQIEKDGEWVDFLKLDLPAAHAVPRPERAIFKLRLREALSDLQGAQDEDQAGGRDSSAPTPST